MFADRCIFSDDGCIFGNDGCIFGNDGCMQPLMSVLIRGNLFTFPLQPSHMFIATLTHVHCNPRTFSLQPFIATLATSTWPSQLWFAFRLEQQLLFFFRFADELGGG